MGAETHLMKNVRFKEIKCQVAIEEELVTTTFCHQHQRREMEGEASNVGSEEKFGKEFFESEGSISVVKWKVVPMVVKKYWLEV